TSPIATSAAVSSLRRSPTVLRNIDIWGKWAISLRVARLAVGFDALATRDVSRHRRHVWDERWRERSAAGPSLLCLRIVYLAVVNGAFWYYTAVVDGSVIPTG